MNQSDEIVFLKTQLQIKSKELDELHKFIFEYQNDEKDLENIHEKKQFLHETELEKERELQTLLAQKHQHQLQFVQEQYELLLKKKDDEILLLSKQNSKDQINYEEQKYNPLEIKDKDQYIQELQSDNQSFREVVVKQQKLISELSKDYKEFQESFCYKFQELETTKDQQIDLLQKQLQEKDEKIDQITEEVLNKNDTEEEVKFLKEIIKDKHKKLELLVERLEQKYKQ